MDCGFCNGFVDLRCGFFGGFSSGFVVEQFREFRCGIIATTSSLKITRRFRKRRRLLRAAASLKQSLKICSNGFELLSIKLQMLATESLKNKRIQSSGLMSRAMNVIVPAVVLVVTKMPKAIWGHDLLHYEFMFCLHQGFSNLF